jgi:ABC-type glucose/galactose transport system permease subunit
MILFVPLLVAAAILMVSFKLSESWFGRVVSIFAFLGSLLLGFLMTLGLGMVRELDHSIIEIVGIVSLYGGLGGVGGALVGALFAKLISCFKPKS